MSADWLHRPLEAADEASAPPAGWRTFALLATAAFVLRVLMAPWTQHGVDMGTFIAWAHRLATVGFRQFWSDDYWCDYLPGYLYVLWGLGKLTAGWPQPLQVLFFKLPNIAADLATAYLIWKLLRPTLTKPKLWLPALYLFNPAIFGNSSLWGQVDSFHALGLVAALYLLTCRQPEWAAALLGYAAAVKPHTVVILPLVALHALCIRVVWYRLVLCVLLAALVFAATFVPFAGSLVRLPDFVSARIDTTMSEYGRASVNAMNLWYLLGQNWRSDGTRLLGPWTTRQIGAALCTAGIALALGWYVARRRRMGALALWESAALVFLATFLFVTRAHERHVFPFFAAALLVAGVHRFTVIPYALISLTSVVNLALSWAYLLPGRQMAQLCDPALGALVCALNVLALPLTVVSFMRWGRHTLPGPSPRARITP